MGLIEDMPGPGNIRGLPPEWLEGLIEEIRAFFVENVSKTSGHLSSSLNIIELTMALHRVFPSPSGVLVFDIGHQSYVHKILTGRHGFSTPRQGDELSECPTRKESVCNVVENSCASTAFSWADRTVRSFELHGEDHRIVAVVGDGAMIGRMVWKALNNITGDPERPIIVVLNGNGRSRVPTVGGITRRSEPVRRLDNFRLNKNYEAFLKWTGRYLFGAGIPERVVYGALHSIEEGVKDIFVDVGIFSSLGLKYIGPADGHDLKDFRETFVLTKNFGGPVVVHMIAEEGRGYHPAEEDTDDRFHAVGCIHPETGLPIRPIRFR